MLWVEYVQIMALVVTILLIPLCCAESANEGQMCSCFTQKCFSLYDYGINTESDKSISMWCKLLAIHY